MSPLPVAKSSPCGLGATEMTAMNEVSNTFEPGHRKWVCTRVLVPLKHQLRIPSPGIPELDAPIFGAREDPFSIGRKCNA